MAETHGVVRETRVEQVVTGSRIGVAIFFWVMPSSKKSNQAFSRIFTHELLKPCQTMVNIARTIPGVLGERMLGGGDKAPLFSKIDDSGTVVDLEMNFTPKLSWNIWNIGLVWDNDG